MAKYAAETERTVDNVVKVADLYRNEIAPQTRQMQATIVAAKHKHAAPDLVIRPNVAIFRTLDFYQASAIIRSAELVKSEIRQKLGDLLSVSA